MMVLIQWWLIFNAAIALGALANSFLPSIPLNRRSQVKLNVMMTTRLMKVPAGWGLICEKQYPHRQKFVRKYKIIQVQIKREAANSEVIHG